MCQIYTEHTKDVDGNPLEFSKVVWFNFGIGEEVVNGVIHQQEHPQEVWVRYTYDVSETPCRVSFYKKSCVNYCLLHLPPPLYQRYPLPIKAAKAADLRKLATEYLPNTGKGMYIDLPAVEDKTDSD